MLAADDMVDMFTVETREGQYLRSILAQPYLRYNTLGAECCQCRSDQLRGNTIRHSSTLKLRAATKLLGEGSLLRGYTFLGASLTVQRGLGVSRGVAIISTPTANTNVTLPLPLYPLTS